MRKSGTQETQNLWKSAAGAALIGLLGAAAMIATEMLLFPELVSADAAAASSAASRGSGAAPAER